LEGEQLPKIEIDAGDGVVDPDSGNGGDHTVACLEHPLHHGEGAFHQGSRSADGFVPPVLLDREGTAADCAVQVLSLKSRGLGKEMDHP
jgi:hypothetical protein